MADDIIDLDAVLEDPDLGLVLDYVQRELPPQQMAEVERRLANDEAFRRFATPIIAAWISKPRLPVPVRPRAEIEAAWDDFTRRAGFVHQRPARRRRFWMRLLAVVALTITATVGTRYAIRVHAARLGEAEQARYSAVPAGGQVVTLGSGTAVKVSEGARIRVAVATQPGAVDTLRILGSATLQLVPSALDSLVRGAAQLTVKTLATVHHSDSVLAIAALSDTTPVAVYSVRADSTSGPATAKPAVTLVPGKPLSIPSAAPRKDRTRNLRLVGATIIILTAVVFR